VNLKKLISFVFILTICFFIQVYGNENFLSVVVLGDIDTALRIVDQQDFDSNFQNRPLQAVVSLYLRSDNQVLMLKII